MRLPGPRGHRDAFLIEQRKRRMFEGPLGRLLSLSRAKGEAMSALCHGLVVDSKLEWSENVTIIA